MKTLEYIELTYKDVEALDRAKTVFFSSISPVETHGPHLPLGTDLFLAEHLRDRVLKKLEAKRPDITAVRLPTLPIGSEAIPVAGSFRVRYKALLYSLLDIGGALADLGFRYWLLTDNHGGPHHQIGIELAARKLRRKNFFLIAPFHESFRRMVARDPDLLGKTGLPPDACGAPDDAHGGTNETSLMRAAFPDKVRDVWKTLGPGKTSPMKGLAKVLAGFENIFHSLGMKDVETDFYFLAHGLAWVSDPQMEPYQGNPSKSSEKAGEAMLEYRANLALELLEEALDGKPRELKPLGWSIRFLRDVM